MIFHCTIHTVVEIRSFPSWVIPSNAAMNINDIALGAICLHSISARRGVAGEGCCLVTLLTCSAVCLPAVCLCSTHTSTCCYVRPHWKHCFLDTRSFFSHFCSYFLMVSLPPWAYCMQKVPIFKMSFKSP